MEELAMRRLYFLVPDAEVAREVTNRLLLAHVPERKIHVIAKNEAAVVEQDLPKAGLLQETDVVPALERGLAVGGATGLLAGLAAVTFPPAGLALGSGAVLLGALGGAGFGAVVAPMLGISAANSQIAKFENAIDQGTFLMMVDVPRDREDEIRELVANEHRDAEIGGPEPRMPPFP
jgi:hypothetical protein